LTKVTTTPSSASTSGGGPCPRCGQADPGPVACPRCGVIFAKLRARSAPAASTPQLNDDTSSRFSWWNVGAVLLVTVCGVAGWRNLRSPATPGAAARAAEARPSRPEAPSAAEPPPPTLAAALAVPSEAVKVEAAGMSDEDRAKADAIVHRMPGVSYADISVAEQLFARHPDELRGLLEVTLLNVADGERRRRRFADATALLQRAVTVETERARPALLLMGTLTEAGDWAGAEAAARTALAREPQNADAWHGLGYALMRQDRNKDAAEALRTALEIRPDSTSQALLDRVAKGMEDERGMTEQQLSHFHVRYDGEAHDDVGREILRALERHYATLVSALDHQPQVTIPVVLFSRESYNSASGAPSWSGGVYDSLDGRIRVPIQGLTRSLTPDMDRTLLHELTHAFVADRTRGIAPRDIQEGLAQYMEGERVTERLTPEQLALLADGRAGGVMGFYLYALSFVEYLVATRGMGGMNDLLRAMGETGSVDEAFRQVHGQDYKATRRAWFQRLHQQHGS
jgi:tetratricopeptide (TPR) repeat protein